MSQPAAAALLWVDDYHAGDPLFFQTLARSLRASVSSGRRHVLVHGAAERAARLLESSAIPYDMSDDIPVSDAPGAADLIQRAYREVNKQIVAVLTEFGVASVGFQGSDRRLLATGNGKPSAGSVHWLEAVLANGTVAVVSAAAAGGESPQPIPVGEAAEALSSAFTRLRAEVLLFCRPGIELDRLHPSERLKALREVVSRPDHEAASRLISGGIPVFCCDPRTAFDPRPGVRTQVFL